MTLKKRLPRQVPTVLLSKRAKSYYSKQNLSIIKSVIYILKNYSLKKIKREF